MRKIRLAGIVAAAVTVVVAAPLARAQAATPIPTRIVLSPSSQAISYAHRQVTVAGTLETRVTAGATPQVLPGEPVQLTLQVADYTVTIPLGDVTTDANGQFSVTTTVPVEGVITATFPGDATYVPGSGWANSYRPLATLAATDLPARITFGPVAPAPVYSMVTVTGQVTMQLPDGSWVPSPYAPVNAFSGENVSWEGFADSNGKFTETFTADPEFPLQLYTFDGDGMAWSGSALSAPLFVPLTTHPTRTQDVLPDVGRVSGSMTLYSQVQYEDDTGQWQAYQGAAARLYFQPGCTGPSAVVETATSDRGGGLTFANAPRYLAHGVPAAGCWQVTVPRANGYLASQSENIRVSVTVPTWLNALMVRRSGRQVHLTGTLDDDHGAGPVARATIGVYREASGIWRWAGSARTGAGGGFSFSLTGRPRGYYEARYAGGAMPGGTVIGRYLPVSGKRISFS